MITGSSRGVLFVVSSPSGGGKTTVIRKAMDRLEKEGFRIHFSVSYTSRPPRTGEKDGIDYNFVDQATFRKMVDDEAFLEWAEYAGNLYGTAKSQVFPYLDRGADVFLDIDVQGAKQVAGKLEDAVLIFILPPSYGELRRRLVERGKDSQEQIEKRLAIAGREIEEAVNFDYAIINDRLEEAVELLCSIVRAEHQRSRRLAGLIAEIRRGFDG